MTVTLDIQAIREELDVERARLRESEQAYVESRVTDDERWLASLERRSERIRQMQLLLDELVALEESAAELAEEFRPEAFA